MLLKTIVAWTLVVCVSVVFAKPPSKVVNGRNAEISEFPHQVSLQVFGFFHICGGSILDATTILTAAHCVIGQTERIEVVTGVTDNRDRRSDNVFEVSNFTYHEKYDPSRHWANDVAILKLAKPIPFNDNQKPINLPSSDVPDGAVVELSGWGAWYNDGKNSEAVSWLQALDVKILSQKTCRRIYGEDSIGDGQVCTLRKPVSGACSGDSGGPLTYDNEIVGIVSWVVIPCGSSYPDVFTRVYDYVSWIKKHM